VLKFSFVPCALALVALLPAAPAQSPTDLFSKAPPDVDQALRDRVSKFFQAHVDGRPRRAEELVAENSKDYFYSMKKSKFLSFEIHKIDYAKDFTDATVVVLVETYMPLMGSTKPMKVPLTSLWKIENGLWCWYITEDIINTTPFGKMGNAPGAAANPNATLPDLKNLPTPQTLAQQVKADKLSVYLKSGQPSSDHVNIENHMSGVVTLALRAPAVPGLEVNVDRTQVPPGGTATVTFQFDPQKGHPKGPARVDIAVEPINSVIHLQATFR